MTLSEAQNLILNAPQFFEEHLAGYQTWGNVNFLQIAVRLNDRKILVSNADKPLNEQTINDFTILPLKGDSYFQKLLFWKWKINVALLTYQEFASQVTETIPPILDDQAQLLGVNIKIASNPIDAVFKTIGRFATILDDKKSICMGSTLEDAFVAAQLLEKTSKAWVLGKYLGGSKPINIIEAWAMQQFYQLKYSKEAQKNV
ncbi:MAG: hypothetical protein M9958_09885 [Chitinophagales bacterium]|nr:hypothetical protein [Chitinophagales bacterium]